MPCPFRNTLRMTFLSKKVFSKIDLRDAFHQIPNNADDIPKTCVTKPFGAFEYVTMSFGLHVASQSFMHFIDSILRNLSATDNNGRARRITILSYIDDTLIGSDNEPYLKTFLNCLDKNNLRLSLHKS